MPLTMKNVQIRKLLYLCMFFAANGPTFRIGVLSTQTTVMATNAAMGFSLTYNQVACE